MSKQTTLINLFVACPSDCDKYRVVVREAIADVNTLLGDLLGVTVKYIGADVSVSPGVATRAQEVINQQIGTHYDIFVGIFALRFGTPTGPFGSGTVEEFTLALERFRKSGRPEVMVYRDRSPVDPTTIDLQQFTSVTQFVTDMQSKGVLTGSFDDTAQFRRDLQAHIGAKIRNLLDGAAVDIKMPECPSKPDGEELPEKAGPEETLGLLDLQVAAEERMETATHTLARLCSYMNDLSGNVSRRSEEMNSLVNSHSPVSARAAKVVVDAISDELRSYSERTNVELPILKREFSAALDAGAKVLVMLVAEEAGTHLPAVAKSRAGLTELIDVLKDSSESLQGLGRSLSTVPVLTSSMSGPKQSAIATVDATVAELGAIRKQCEATLSLLEGLG